MEARDMNETLKEYLFYALAMIGFPVVIYFFGVFTGENPTIISMFKFGLLMGMYLLAARGLGSYFPKENLAKRSIPTLIEQHVLTGVLFAAVMVFMQDFLNVAPERSAGSIMTSFLIMAVFFGGGMFAASLLERRSLLRSLPDA
jgi:hypothetical protein